MKKLMQQKDAAEFAINVLCDLTKQHSSMCEWEQECSDNPLLFDPVFARRYTNERKSWLINKQSMCAKCKLQLGEHLINHQAQPAANTIDASNDSLQFLISQQFFDEDTSQDLIKIQKQISDTRSDEKANSEQNLINAQKPVQTLDEIFLIDNSLCKPLLTLY
jgi:hypothetical protein